MVVGFNGDGGLAGRDRNQHAVRGHACDGFIGGAEVSCAGAAGGQLVAQLHNLQYAQRRAAAGDAYAGRGLFDLDRNLTACAGGGGDGDGGTAHLLAGDQAFIVYAGDGGGLAGICNRILCAFGQHGPACDAGALLHAQHQAGGGGDDLLGEYGTGSGHHHHDRGFILNIDDGGAAACLRVEHGGRRNFSQDFGDGGFQIKACGIEDA